MSLRYSRHSGENIFDVAKMIMARHPGKWEIKYNENNSGAKKLWNIVAAPFKPEAHHLNEEETVLSFNVVEME